MRMVGSVAWGGDMRRCYRETRRASRIVQARNGRITNL
ncbi:hypothetical protein C7S15_8004 [Burkholderia cepacia]|nr:hypothetical protein [Burkholderia cepacia]